MKILETEQKSKRTVEFSGGATAEAVCGRSLELILIRKLVTERTKQLLSQLLFGMMYGRY